MKYLNLFLIGLFFTLHTHAQQQELQQKLYYKKTIEHLASDKLEGRLTGMPGELLSAEYIKNEMIASGLKPVSDNNFIQKFEFTYLRLPTSNNHMHIGFKDSSATPIFGKDYLVMSESGSNYNTGGISTTVFDAGYGLVANKKKGILSDYQQYTKADSGKIFIIKIGNPNIQSELSKAQTISSIQQKIKAALAKGASGIVFINPNSVQNQPTGAMELNGFVSKIPIVFYKKNIGNLKNIKEIGMITDIAQIKKTGHNVMASVIRNPKKKFIVIGAHHDHLGRAEMGGSKTIGQKIHNGANDNASGVAMLLHLAKTLPNHKAFKKYNLLFVAFSGEEHDLLGSKYFLRNCPIDTKNILAMVNINRVGRLDTQNNTMEINGVGSSPYWLKRIKRIKVDTAELKINTWDGGRSLSDHNSFYKVGIPAVHISSGDYKEYHMPEDDAAIINYKGMVKIEDYTIKLMCKIKRRRRKFTRVEQP